MDYEYKAVNLLKGEQSDPGGLILGSTRTVQPCTTRSWDSSCDFSCVFARLRLRVLFGCVDALTGFGSA